VLYQGGSLLSTRLVEVLYQGGYRIFTYVHFQGVHHFKKGVHKHVSTNFENICEKGGGKEINTLGGAKHILHPPVDPPTSTPDQR